jgi:predicted secreted Zn-dependent protease
MSSPAPTSSPPASASPAAAGPNASAAAPSTPASSAPSASTPTADASARAELLPIAGVWRVRKVLDPTGAWAGTVEDPAFGEETYAITPGCPAEPCAALEVTTTPLGLTGPATVIQLTRDGAMYRSAAQPAQPTACRAASGDRVDGGANASSTLRLWIQADRPAGSSVASTNLHGIVDIAIDPTPIGVAAGCESQAAAFDLTGRREVVAVRDPGGSVGDGVDRKPPVGAALVRLPRLSPKVNGATVDFFDITGDTAIELVGSVGRGGAKACGLIDYEWFRGDALPSACTLTRMSDTRQSIKTSVGASGACRVTSADVRASYVIHMPRWTAPAQVPKRLLDWWRLIVDKIADHEAGHIRIGRDYVRRLNARLEGKPCGDVPSIIRSWVTQHAGAQEAYDRAEYAKSWPQPALGY